MTAIDIPLSAPDITDAEINAVVSVLRTPRLSLGPQMEQFEAAMAADPEIAELARCTERGAAALAWTVPPRQPPKAVRDRIEDAIRRDAR